MSRVLTMRHTTPSSSGGRTTAAVAIRQRLFSPSPSYRLFPSSAVTLATSSGSARICPRLYAGASARYLSSSAAAGPTTPLSKSSKGNNASTAATNDNDDGHSDSSLLSSNRLSKSFSNLLPASLLRRRQPPVNQQREQYGQPTHDTHPHLVAKDEIAPGITAAEYEDRRRRLMEKMPAVKIQT
ncbi:hypothetical protein GQ42DRAFT_157769 [Ramicandelaber brevisporus]|nr:hypothetical protein GQ42DRAFT_157769 [Ramicandelaber brevisporus]